VKEKQSYETPQTEKSQNSFNRDMDEDMSGIIPQQNLAEEGQKRKKVDIFTKDSGCKPFLRLLSVTIFIIVCNTLFCIN
jgi:hypothetical protein